MLHEENPTGPTLSLPVPPAEPAATPFPLVASLAPLAASGIIWLVTSSPFALLFAGLSPLIAMASFADRRIGARRRRRREARAYAEALDTLRESVRAEHARERDALLRRTPPAGAVLAADEDPERWRPADGDRLTVVLGLGTVPSMLRVAGTASGAPEAEMLGEAARLTDAPVCADARGGIGIVGPPPLADAFARSLVVQLARLLPPAQTRLSRQNRAGWGWLASLPHHAADAGRAGAVRVVGGDGDPPAEAASGGGLALVAIAGSLARIPTSCRTIVAIDSVASARIVTPAREDPVVRPELTTVAQARTYAAALSQDAAAGGLAPRAVLPRHVDFAELIASPTAGDACPIGRSAEGVVSVDLFADGPHAIVGGTTGSGKSELLITWIAGMAARMSPREATFLLVDFKGGATFRTLTALPHCVGVITDLDAALARRALESLRAELRHRERILADHGARDVSDERMRSVLPRLVIVVDEFAAMVDAFPELHALFVDVASRGRSLGVHLVLCTQQPAAAARDALLANCNLRLSLRVNNRADSQAVIGSDEAAALEPASPGRLLLTTGGRRIGPIQVAVATVADVEDVARRSPTDEVRRPWLDPLPARVRRNGPPPDDGFLIGIVDDPSAQDQHPGVYRPSLDGHLLAVGAHRSGKSMLVAALAAQSRAGLSVERVPDDVEGAWDVVMATASGLGRRRPSVLLVLDDLDALVGRFGPEHAETVLDALTRILRDGPASGVSVVATLQRISGALHAPTALFSQVLLLRMPSRQEHVLAGGESGEFDPGLPPGAGMWRGRRIQLFEEDEPASPVSPPPDPVDLGDEPCIALVSQRAGIAGEPCAGLGGPDRRVVSVAEAALESRLPEPVVIAGDADAWHAQWTFLTEMRARAVFVFEGCSPADVRTVTGRRVLPPPVAGPGRVWMSRPDGSITRAVLG